MNPIARQLISDAEGLRLIVYDDQTGHPITPGMEVHGHPTIGYGRALDVHGITQEEALQLLDNTLNEIETTLAGYVWFPSLDGARQAVLIDMAYNMGLSNFYDFVSMIHALESADYLAAANAMLESKWAREVPERAQRDAQIMIHGTL